MKEERQIKNKNFLEACKNALNGLRVTFKTQWNFKIEVCFAIIAIIFSILFKITKLEFLYIVFSITFVFISELINTAIETIVNMITEEYNDKAKIAKDIAAGAVYISALNSLIVAIVIFVF